MKKLIVFSMLFVMSFTAFAAKSLIKIVSPGSDAVTTESVDVVAVTSPSAKATINGEQVHVYKTGSFGAPVDLKMGDNTITITVTDGSLKETKTINVYRKEKGKKTATAAAPSPSPSDVIFDAPYTGYTKQGAFLVYGNGNDRLGGSKMGFIAEGIPLTVTGENGDLYRVQLSDNRYAYIEKAYIESGEQLELDAVNTGSWRISNQGKTDRITISLPRRLPYRAWTLLDPSTICIEVFGAMDNSNWITQTGALGIIDYAYFEQPESDVYKIVIRLKDKFCWGYSIDYNGNALVIDVRHRPESLQLKDLVIGLDAGHGGTSSGAVSPSGLKESVVNLDIILKLRDLLEREGATVVLTRNNDTSLSMAERKRILREANVDLSISVHNNAGGSPFKPMGASVYYKHLFDRPFAVCMHKSMMELGVADYGLTSNFNFSLNGPTDYPNVLVECLFMSNLVEEEMLADSSERQKIAGKILEGLKSYLHLCKQ